MTKAVLRHLRMVLAWFPSQFLTMLYLCTWLGFWKILTGEQVYQADL